MPDITPHEKTVKFFAIMREIVECPEAPTPETLEIVRNILKDIVDEFLALPLGTNPYDGSDLTHFFAAIPPGIQFGLICNLLKSSNNSLKAFAKVSYAVHRPEDTTSADPLNTLLGILGKILAAGDLGLPPPPLEK